MGAKPAVEADGGGGVETELFAFRRLGAIASIALTTRDLGSSFCAPISGEGATDFNAVLELAAAIASDVPFVLASVDELACRRPAMTGFPGTSCFHTTLPIGGQDEPLTNKRKLH